MDNNSPIFTKRNPPLTLNHFAQESGITYGAHVNTGQELMCM